MGRANPELVDRVGRLIAGGPKDRPPLIAIVGAQGSGKTTLARAAADRFGAAQISIDDVYLTRAEREAMARDVHPLFVTRGPPGTHDLGLLQQLIDTLSAAGRDDETRIPDFDKRGDDRRQHGRIQAVLGRQSGDQGVRDGLRQGQDGATEANQQIAAEAALAGVGQPAQERQQGLAVG